MMKKRIPDIMKTKTLISSKVAADLFSIQVKWSAWFIAVIVLLYVFIIFHFEQGIFALSYGSTLIFMLVLGIVAGNFLPFYVKHGVTRKNYYLGSVLAAFGLSFALSVVFCLLSGIESIIYANFDLGINLESFNSLLIIEGSTNWYSSVLIYALNVYAFYLLGWFIYLGFYRFKWVTGIGFCLMALLFAFLHGLFWKEQLLPSFAHEIAYISAIVPLYIAILETVVLIGLLLVLIRLLTKKIPINVDCI